MARNRRKMKRFELAKFDGGLLMRLDACGSFQKEAAFLQA